MPLTFEQKKQVVSELNETFNVAYSAVLANYSGLDVQSLTELRSDARSKNVQIKVVRNSLAKRAIEGTSFECLSEDFKGQIIVGLSMEDLGSAAKVFKDFIKENEELTINAISVNGQRLGPEKLKEVASLPSRDEALSMLACVIQAPVTKLVRTFNDVPGRLVRVISAYGDTKK